MDDRIDLVDLDMPQQPPTPPPAGEQDDGIPFVVALGARTKPMGRWVLVAQGYDSRLAAERDLRLLRPRFPELELRVVVLGFPDEHSGELPEDHGYVRIGVVLQDVMGSLLALRGLMGDEERALTRAQLRVRHEGLRAVGRKEA